MDKRRRWKVHLEWGGCPGVPGGRRPGPAGAELRRRGRVPVFRRHGPRPLIGMDGATGGDGAICLSPVRSDCVHAFTCVLNR